MTALLIAIAWTAFLAAICYGIAAGSQVSDYRIYD